MSQPVLTLNNGVRMPAIGLGVFQSPPAQTLTAVRTALEAGYRLIDTASLYGNEREVGQAVRESGLDRAEVFVTSKLWIADYGYDQALAAFGASLDRLGLDYLDLYLVHWPVPADFEATIASYRAAEKLLSDGFVRAIGVCNHTREHLRRLCQATHVVPAVNQIELHPFFTQGGNRAANDALGIVTQSWSPLGGVKVYRAKDPGTAVSPLDHPVIRQIARAHGTGPAQVIVRWHLQHGLSPIPKSVRPERIRSNADVLGFELSEEQMARIDALDTGVRGGPDPEVVEPRLYGPTPR